MKMTQIVYVQPGSIYLVIGAKTSSVRNMINVVYVTGKISIRQTFVFRRGKSSGDSSPSAVIIHTGDSH